MRATTRLRELLARPGVIRSLGAHDVFTARLVEAAGLETVFLGGFGTSASLLGVPDIGLITLTEMADAVRRMAGRVQIPVVADGDTGHGDLHNVVRTVREFEQAGAAGILLEDQVTPKRCGHFEGKALISADEMVRRKPASPWTPGAIRPGAHRRLRTDARGDGGQRDRTVPSTGRPPLRRGRRRRDLHRGAADGGRTGAHPGARCRGRLWSTC
ncbi:MAG: isocitrate lyase/PEP mutase family protein [Gemmataceae bacterium]